MEHKPVLIQEIVEHLRPQDHLTYIDATFGGGGYSKAFKKVAPQCRIIGFDRDPLIAASENVRKYTEAFYPVPFSKILHYVTNHVESVIFDFGVSSFQIDDPLRGFSFQKEGPLDMRMSQSGVSAYNVVNQFSEKELADIIYYYGEERRAYQVAKVIVNKRPFETTLELANAIASVVPKSKIHPATRTFQGLRIYVNNELEEIKEGLRGALEITDKILAVTFHGLEDRVVKEVMRKHAWKEIEKIFPSRGEVAANPRSRSAKLHIYERR